MRKFALVLLAAATMALPASAQQSPSTAVGAPRQMSGETAPSGKDQIGLTPTQRQMIAWSIAGLAEMQPAPPSFRPQLGAKVPSEVNLSQVPGIVQGVAPPAAGYEYAMLKDKDLLLVKPQDDTIADVIHLNRRL